VSKQSWLERAEKAEAENAELREKYAALVDAAEAVYARWQTPAWKDAEPTAYSINKMRDALAALKGEGK